MKPYFFFILLIVLFSNCEAPSSSNQKDVETPTTPSIEQPDTLAQTPKPQETPKPKAIEKPRFQMKYQLANPTKKFKLSGKLAEISGLSISSNGQFLLAHNDEQGKIFFLNKETGKIDEDFKFHKSGDYEGIEMVGETIYVLKNNGTIFEVRNPNSDDQKTKSYKTELSAANDVEGLGYDAKNNRLLLACKAKAGDGKEYKRKRAIYGFDLSSKKLIEKPVYLIDREAIKNFIQKNSDRFEKFLETFAPEQAASAFAPSGISIHPKTGDVYILSSVGKLLVVLNSNGSIIHIEQLDKNIHRQPEGIAFENDGTLWISSEGKGSSARLFRF